MRSAANASGFRSFASSRVFAPLNVKIAALRSCAEIRTEAPVGARASRTAISRRHALLRQARQDQFTSRVLAELDQRRNIMAEASKCHGGINRAATAVRGDILRLVLAPFLQQQKRRLGVAHGHPLDTLTGNDGYGVDHGTAECQRFHPCLSSIDVDRAIGVSPSSQRAIGQSYPDCRNLRCAVPIPQHPAPSPLPHAHPKRQPLACA